MHHSPIWINFRSPISIDLCYMRRSYVCVCDDAGWLVLMIIETCRLICWFCASTAPRMQQRSMRTFAQQQPNVEAMKRDFARTMGAAAVGYTTFMNTAPAQALVDERMNGDGAGLKLGINDSRLFFIIAGVFTTVWAVYSQSVKGISNNDDDDSGLGLS